jgi:hypothetical protein
VSVSVPIPAGTGRDSHVIINGVTVARQPVVSGLSLPVTLSIITGMHAPLRLEKAASCYYSTLVITADNTMYIPKYDSPSVRIFAADGTSLPPLPVASVGLSGRTRMVAFVVESTNTLLLAGLASPASLWQSTCQLVWFAGRRCLGC